jgi:pimeloyl-ACP methyl ester carboxylesterase
VAAVCAPAAVWAQGQTFDSDGTEIYYEIHGEGEPVVLIHGFSASGMTNWAMPGILPKIAAHYKVILPDMRGHGKSGKPHGKENYGANMADDVLRLLDHLGIERAHIAGYSMGGFITANLLARHPERFITATIGGAGVGQPNAEDDLTEEIAVSLENGGGIAPLLEYLSPEGTAEAEMETIRQTNNAVIAMNDPLALAGAIRGMRDLQFPESALAENPVPTLAVIGGADPLKSTTDALVAVKPNVTLVELEGKTHITAMGDPEFPAAMIAFYEAHPAGRASAVTDDD